MTDPFYTAEFPNGHFYSPYPSKKDVAKNAVGPGRPVPPSLTGIETHDTDQWCLWETFDQLSPDSYMSDKIQMETSRYTFENGMFNRCDAATLHCMLRHLNPRKIIEIGSGYTSCVTLDTREYHDLALESFTLIEPYPSRLKERLKPADYDFCKILENPVQEVDTALFESLEAGDLLFIDSTHVCKSGSDVLFEFCEILPRLAEGVVIHIHDILWPFEYPLKWYEKGRAWNETFMLRSLLANSENYKIMLHPHYLLVTDRERFLNGNWELVTSGGSIYLEKGRHGV